MSTNFHNFLQSKIQKLGKSLGYTSQKEFYVGDRGDGRGGYIDIAWLDNNNKIIYAFELDSKIRKKSIYKLVRSGAECKIWICWSERWVSWQDRPEIDGIDRVFCLDRAIRGI